MSPTHPPQVSYLTCTASQAATFNTDNPHHFASLNQLLESRARSHPDVCVASFPEREVSDGPWAVLTFTFSSLLAASNAVARRYMELSSLTPRITGDKRDRIIALLSPSCADLLVTLFAALRMGYGVLLLAPQNTPEAMAHLCRVTSATHLICHRSLLDLGRDAMQSVPHIELLELVPHCVWTDPSANLPLVEVGLSPKDEKDLTALVMHTSGSTGMPKPIYHPHRLWTEAIPCMPGEAAFTTTPLFHGGSADFLRSLNALSTLYLFSSLYPVTISNVLGAVSACPDAAAFLSVPYILKMLAENAEGLRMLQRMKLVSTGGAPLSEQLGNDMVRKGVKLVSRMGSSECGFLMSSHRDYDDDQEWSWLRNDGLGLELLHFEAVEGSENMFELVVDKAWSTRVVSNRDDGSFATGDLYAKHCDIPNAWKYCGRVDDMIVMTNGKKASANPIESGLRSSPDIVDAIVFGEARPMLGALIVPASPSVTIASIKSKMRKINSTLPSYARVIDDMLIVLPYDVVLPKTSKGSIVRPRALIQLSILIEDAYLRVEAGDATALELDVKSDVDVENYVRQLVTDVVQTQTHGSTHRAVRDEEDLFNLGLSSVHATQIRNALQKLVASRGQVLDSNVVFEHPTIAKLADHILDIYHGKQRSPGQSYHDVMDQLLHHYGSFNGPQSGDAKQTSHITGEEGVVIITGATGALGAHLVAQFIARTSMRIVALVRAVDGDDAVRRILTNLERRKLLAGTGMARITSLASDLGADMLGLGEQVYTDLLKTAEIVIHAAWPVNFAYGLESFEPALIGTRILMKFAASSSRRAKMIFCSSVAAVSYDAQSTERGPVHEVLPQSKESCPTMGYAQSKWVAEYMCENAHRTILPGRIAIARIGQLCGDTEHGIWNESEGWPLLIASVRYTGFLPLIQESPSWLPLDIAAEAITDIALAHIGPTDVLAQLPIYHVVNPHTTPWLTLLDYLESSALDFERTSPTQWIDRLSAQLDELDPYTRQMLELWARKYASTEVSTEPIFDTAQAKRISNTMENAQPISENLVSMFVAAWKDSGFLSHNWLRVTR